MTKKKIWIIAASTVGVLMVAALTAGVINKMQRTAEMEAYLTQQQTQYELEKAASEAAVKAASSNYVIPPIKSNEERRSGKQGKTIEPEKAVTSAPEVFVSTDESGNQVITPEWEVPVTPPHEDVHNPEKPPETPDVPKKPETPAPGTPNEKGEIYVPGFGWQKPTGGHTEQYDVDLSGNLIGY